MERLEQSVCLVYDSAIETESFAGNHSQFKQIIALQFQLRDTMSKT